MSAFLHVLKKRKNNEEIEVIAFFSRDKFCCDALEKIQEYISKKENSSLLSNIFKDRIEENDFEKIPKKRKVIFKGKEFSIDPKSFEIENDEIIELRE